MLKSQERDDPNSCWNKAHDDEMIFVVLARDVAGPGTVGDWCNRRTEAGCNTVGDNQIIEARHCAKVMEETRSYHQQKKELAKLKKELEETRKKLRVWRYPPTDGTPPKRIRIVADIYRGGGLSEVYAGIVVGDFFYPNVVPGCQVSDQVFRFNLMYLIAWFPISSDLHQFHAEKP